MGNLYAKLCSPITYGPPRLYHLSKNKYAQFLSVKLPSMFETNVCERYRHVLLEYYISFCLAALHAIDTVIRVFLFRYESSFVPILIFFSQSVV